MLRNLNGVFHAADSPRLAGRGMPSGHIALSGHVSDMNRMTRSNVDVFTSPPATMRLSAPPALKRMVDTRDRESPLAVP